MIATAAQIGIGTRFFCEVNAYQTITNGLDKRYELSIKVNKQLQLNVLLKIPFPWL